MRVIVTGSSGGIGKAIVEEFVCKGHIVIGIDRFRDPIHTSIVLDITDDLPDIDPVDILINCAGVQGTTRDIDVNLKGLIAVTEKYAFQPAIKAVINIASTSAHNGAEFPEYVASKGGVLAYTKYTAIQLAKYGATCNSISPGAVITDMNAHILEDSKLHQKVAKKSLLKKWATPEEIAEWVYFLAVTNKSMTGQDVIVDNGELSKFKFVW